MGALLAHGERHIAAIGLRPGRVIEFDLAGPGIIRQQPRDRRTQRAIGKIGERRRHLLDVPGTREIGHRDEQRHPLLRLPETRHHLRLGKALVDGAQARELLRQKLIRRFGEHPPRIGRIAQHQLPQIGRGTGNVLGQRDRLRRNGPGRKLGPEPGNGISVEGGLGRIQNHDEVLVHVGSGRNPDSLRATRRPASCASPMQVGDAPPPRRIPSRPDRPSLICERKDRNPS